MRTSRRDPPALYAHDPASVDFKSKKIRINLNTPIKAEQKAESTDVLKTVDEDRKYVIQATIVRYVISFLPYPTPVLIACAVS